MGKITYKFLTNSDAIKTWKLCSVWVFYKHLVPVIHNMNYKNNKNLSISHLEPKSDKTFLAFIREGIQ